jgi:hypothetical protein
MNNQNKITEKDLLKLAGKLAISCEMILNSNVCNLSENIKYMEQQLIEYNNLIVEHTIQNRKGDDTE